MFDVILRWHYIRSSTFQWFRLIIDNRPNYDEDVTQLNDINDVRNGVYASSQIHTEFGPRRVVILKVRRVCRLMFVLIPLPRPRCSDSELYS